MEQLTLEAHSVTPYVDLDPGTGVFTFKGESYPENVLAFYRPIIDWIKEYFESSDEARQARVHVDLRYMNTSTTKVFMVIFDLCQDASAKGHDVAIHWYHHADDDLIREMGEDLSDGLKLPFHFIAEA